ncbi:MAG: hypothetical protein AB7R89_05995 [Dehalococcoidia bacterium]
MNETTIFFEEAFGDLPAAAWLLVWTLPDKGSRFFRDHAQAAAYATARAEEHDVYVGVGLRGRDYSPRRGGTADVTGIVGFWADLDIADPVHKKPNLPPNEGEAINLLNRLPLRPTLKIHSGHGMQAWWLFIEPYLFDDAADRERVEQISAGWSDLLKAQATPHGWDVDSVWDLARVLRVPGTTNHKRLPVPVFLLSDDGPRYSGPRDFLDYVTLQPPGPKVSVNGVHAADGQASVDVGGLVLRPDAEPPFSKWLALLENDAKFAQTWKRKRRDLQDQSSSGYHMSLATQTALCGWTDQEIVNLCIAWQRQHVEDMAKVLRPDYWLGSAARTGTLAKARQVVNQERAAAVLAGDSEEEPPDDHAGLLGTVSDLFGVPVSGWIQHGSQRARYSLQLTDGREVAIGPTTAVLSPDQFRARLYEQARVTLPIFKKERWLRIAATLSKAATVVENQEVTREHVVREWIAGYLTSTSVLRDGSAEDYGEAIAAGRPFVRDEVLHIHAPSLRKYVVLSLMEQIESTDLHDALRAVGFISRQRYGRTRLGRGRKKWYWCLPEGAWERGTSEESTGDTAIVGVMGAISP